MGSSSQLCNEWGQATGIRKNANSSKLPITHFLPLCSRRGGGCFIWRLSPGWFNHWAHQGSKGLSWQIWNGNLSWAAHSLPAICRVTCHLTDTQTLRWWNRKNEGLWACNWRLHSASSVPEDDTTTGRFLRLPQLQCLSRPRLKDWTLPMERDHHNP